MNLNSKWTYCNLEIRSPEGWGCSTGAPRLAVPHSLCGGREGRREGREEIQLLCCGPTCTTPSPMDWAVASTQWAPEQVSGNFLCGASRSSSGENKLMEKPESPAHPSGAVLWARLDLRKPHKLSQIAPLLWPVEPKLSPWQHSSATWSVTNAPTIKGSAQTTSYPAGTFLLPERWVQRLQ